MSLFNMRINNKFNKIYKKFMNTKNNLFKNAKKNYNKKTLCNIQKIN